MQRRGKALVAMSGGVDSSVAAALLVREGWEVVGCFMRLGSPGETLGMSADAGDASAETTRIGHRGCCSIADAADARLVAAELGIPLYVCNFKRDFGRIVDHFVDEYARGRTPNPCVRCNDWLKFGKLHEYARQIDADVVASGHYARVERTAGGEHRLRRGVDVAKDQSYVLFGVPRDRLGEMLLPIGGHRKPEIREMAEAFGLPVFDKPESQEICFVPDDDYAGLVERARPELATGGAIVDERGREIGRHQGQHRFTIGQRRGIGVALGYPLYVVDKTPESNTVTVGPRRHLEVVACTAAEANWLVADDAYVAWQPVLAQVRAHGDAVPAEVCICEVANAPTPSGRRGGFEVRFAEPQPAVAPGQAIVLYDPDEPDLVVGGGWVASTERAAG